MKRAAQTKQYAELDHAIKTKVEPYLYNRGQGRKIPISQIVLLRNKERSKSRLVQKQLIHELGFHKNNILAAAIERVRGPGGIRH